MKKILFTIAIKNINYSGYLGTNDMSNPPKNWFVFLNAYIVGELDFIAGKWNFAQRGRYKFLGQLTKGECNYLAEHLGNIAQLGWECL
jgi:hypothetical protein